MSRRGGMAAALWLGLAASAALADVTVAPLTPQPPDFRGQIARQQARVAALVEGLEPPPAAEGQVEVIDTTASPLLRKSFIDGAERMPSWTGRTMRLAGGGWDLPRLAQRLGDPTLLECRRQACELRGPLFIEAGASLRIGPQAGAGELRLSRAHGAFIVSLGILFVRDATVESDAATHPADVFRPFLLVYDTGRLVLASSRLAHLGFDAPTAYGVTLTTSDRSGAAPDRPSALIHDSEFRDLHYGFYSHEARGVDIVDSRYIDSVHYGIDPHDGTEAMWVAGNTVYGTRIAHGIIASREVKDIVVHGNRSFDNGGAGIALDRGVTSAIVSGNTLTGNGSNGITLYESHGVVVEGNRILRNRGNGIRLRHSSGVWIENNRIEGNARHGLEASSRTPERQATPEEASYAKPVALTLAGNGFLRNGESACNFKGIARLDLVPGKGGLLAPCGRPEALAGDKDWTAAIVEVWNDRTAVRLEGSSP